jgi:hypothetical protein
MGLKEMREITFRWINCRPIPCEVNRRAIQGVAADSKDDAIIYTCLVLVDT